MYNSNNNNSSSSITIEAVAMADLVHSVALFLSFSELVGSFSTMA